MRVMKFGGTSVQDAEAMNRLVEIVETRRGERFVVVSALAKVTDQLLDLIQRSEQRDRDGAITLIDALEARHRKVADDLSLNDHDFKFINDLFKNLKNLVTAFIALGEVSERSRDAVVSVGELASSHLVMHAFQKKGYSCQWVDARALIKTDAQFTHAHVNFSSTERACAEWAQMTQTASDSAAIFITQGFIGSSEAGVTTTLGRGGSDYSAAILGAALHADRIEIWTDVDGILTTDPRMVPRAYKIKRISFSEAAELASFGAKVLHPATIHPAVQKNIPVYVLNSKNATNSGTEITAERKSYSGVIKAIACKRKITVLNIYSTRMLGASGFLKLVFDILARHQISIDLISTSEVNVSMTVDAAPHPQALDAAVSDLQELAQVSVEHNQTIVSVVGDGIRHTPGVAAQIFAALKGINVRMISMGASELNLSCVVEGTQTERAVASLHSEFFSGALPVDVFET